MDPTVERCEAARSVQMAPWGSGAYRVTQQLFAWRETQPKADAPG